MTQENDSRQLPLPHVEKSTPPWMESALIPERYVVFGRVVETPRDELRRIVAELAERQAGALDARRRAAHEAAA